ncbi:S-DNA-T family DNA segregation ATPase FtsK/SpoIIIE [Humitalea rosea]|uniref:S-DNA-T family DNA segregation ATPase FtsK/SpoIIIE n=1 Tax=Humitalea rosea TaxID=990373 RepID=A0A2W7I0H3_9PROT|nr:FtsK/SpoIIIE domain-containing protein [Humitalea rosea]PZW40411.1 S-DNA-T family DNA segregation ATPase FtsK/SpoIIIE [Humitalea rosea]
MVDRVYLSVEERGLLNKILADGLGQRGQRDPQWSAARIALARSLQITEAPDLKRFAEQSGVTGGSEIHARQLTGEGAEQDEDYTDVYRALLSVYTGTDLFADEGEFHRHLQAHLRRGIRDITEEWKEDSSFADYLLRELFFDRGEAATAGEMAPELAERVSRILGQIGVGARVVETREGPRISRFELELAELEDLDRLRKGLGKIAFALGWGENAVTSSLAPGERRVYLSIPRPAATWRTVDWSQVRDALGSPAAKAMALPGCMGTDVLGAPFVFDLAEAPHLFVGGTTGSGKSMCLHALLLSMLTGPTPPELLLIDPKAVEFNAYAGNRNVRGGKPVTSADDAMGALDELVAEMGARQEVMSALDVRNIAEANARGAGLRRIVAVIDELGDLFMTKREIEVPLIRLAQKARSSGIHLVLATQRPEAATFPGLLRSNVPSRIALTVQKASESRIILDEGGAESLLMRGDMLIRLAGRPTERAHGCRVTTQDIQEALAR